LVSRRAIPLICVLWCLKRPSPNITLIIVLSFVHFLTLAIIICFASLGSYRRMLDFNCSVPIALVFWVVNYGRLTLTASKIFALRGEITSNLGFTTIHSPLVRLFASYGLTVALNDSFFGRNVLFCARLATFYRGRSVTL